MKRFCRWLLLACLCFPLSGYADTLTLTGAAGYHVVIDLREIDAAGQAISITSTQWSGRAHRWSGMRLVHLIGRVPGGPYSRVHIRALNDYEVDIPLGDVRRFSPLLATRRDGQLVAIRDKGPLLLIWPFDQEAVLERSQRYHDWSVWHISQIGLR